MGPVHIHIHTFIANVVVIVENFDLYAQVERNNMLRIYIQTCIYRISSANVSASMIVLHAYVCMCVCVCVYLHFMRACVRARLFMFVQVGASRDLHTSVEINRIAVKICTIRCTVSIHILFAPAVYTVQCV